jgi:glycosyltransferase involved in cell wall biosynthesis
LITVEDHLWRGRDGHIYGYGPTSYSVWSELLDSFDEVVLLARVGGVCGPCTSENRVDGQSIVVHNLADYAGPWSYLLNLSALQKRVRQSVALCDAYLLQVPGLIGRLAWQQILRLRKPYAAEVLADPWDAMGPGTMPSPLRPLYRRVARRNLRLTCERAVATLYWSGGPMRKRYPPARDAHSGVSPRINLCCGYAPSEIILKRFRRIDQCNCSIKESRRHLRTGFIGSLAQLYKGADTLLYALARCPRIAFKSKTFFVGEGRYRNDLESLCRKLSVETEVSFLGRLEFGRPIFDFLDSIDLFVMPSRAEGLPRALVEAMARGCPCIGSNVGGIPELLAPEDLVPPNDPEALARKIMEVTANPQRMQEMSIRNLARAKQFDPETLRDVRRDFYRYVRHHSGSNAKSGEAPIKSSTLQLL